MRQLAFMPLCGALLSMATLVGQQPAFEVASIKPRSGVRVFGGPESPTLFSRPDITLRQLIGYAYEVQDFQIVGPDWMATARYEILAKAPHPPARGEMRLMVRRLLEERFALNAHIETRELPIYELIVARSDRDLGSSVKPAIVNCVPFLLGQRPMTESPFDDDGISRRCSAGGRGTGDLVTPRLKGIPMAWLALFLQPLVRRAVVDKTGIDGSLDFDLTFSSDGLAGLPPIPGERADGPGLFTALQEQLGLKLESARGPVPMVVIDRVERPTPD